MSAPYGLVYCPRCDKIWELDSPDRQPEQWKCDCGETVRLGECESEGPR